MHPWFLQRPKPWYCPAKPWLMKILGIFLIFKFKLGGTFCIRISLIFWRKIVKSFSAFHNKMCAIYLPAVVNQTECWSLVEIYFLWPIKYCSPAENNKKPKSPYWKMCTPFLLSYTPHVPTEHFTAFEHKIDRRFSYTIKALINVFHTP